jgi:hypothetical protein
MGLAKQFFMNLDYKYVKIYAFSNTHSFYYRNTDLNFEKVAHVSLNMSKLSVKEQLLCINANYLQATLCYLTGQQLAHCGGREGKKQKYLYLTQHVHYFMKSLSNGSCETITKFQRVYIILETMYVLHSANMCRQLHTNVVKG